jgi:glycosyltransferase involved in cell wall biosynthesis
MNAITLSIIIPVYNERDTIRELLSRVQEIDLEEAKKEIIVVDDASTDGSYQILSDLQQEITFKLLRHDKNLGKGGALQTGFQQATGDYIIVQDADLEYYPQEIPDLLRVAWRKGKTIVYGSRNLKRNPHPNLPSSRLYKLGGKLITLFFNLLFAQKLTDINTCYKLFPRQLLQEINLREKRFAFCEEFTCQAIKNGYKIIEVPISYSPRSFSQGKKIHWWHGLRSIYVIFKNRFF